MGRRARPSGISLSEADAAIVKGMLERGDRQHDIAAWFGVNSGRVAEIATGVRFPWVQAASAEQLPPPGPYPCGREAHAVAVALAQAQQALVEAERMLQERLRQGT